MKVIVIVLRTFCKKQTKLYHNQNEVSLKSDT